LSGKNLADGRIMQTAFVTDDIERSVREFGKTYNIGGWAIIRSVGFDAVTLRGKPCDAAVRAAVAFQGDMMYEFIQPLDDRPSVYRDKTSNAASLGFHHLAYLVPDLAAAIAGYEAKGYTLAMRCTVGGGEGAYMEGGDPGTGMIELLEAGPAVDAFIAGASALESTLVDGDVQITYW
jgi:catechol 2,3-dioxygenase-like lactoylglutathione lyase family enzyme